MPIVSISPYRKPVPQPIPVFAFADRRCAFVKRVAVGDLFGREEKIVRARLDKERQTLFARLGDHRQRIG